MRAFDFGSGRRLRFVWFSMFALTLLCSACNRSSVKLYPVRGQVFYKNQPASGAQIVFQPADQSTSDQTSSEAAKRDESTAKQPMAYGSVAPDGSFVLRSFPHGEGAAAGSYNVLITWYAADPRNAEKTVSKLPEKYADQSRPAFKIVVKEQKNELEPFRLN